MNSFIDQIIMAPAGSAPLISKLCDELDLSGIVNRTVTWDPKQCRTAPGTLIKGLVLNVLSGRKALYRVHEYFREQDLEVLFGSGIQADAFNDDALGRAMDKMADASPKLIYSNLILSAITKNKITVGSVHADTTSKSVHGVYEGSEASETEDSLFITHGYSKDHRPDLKQFMYGLITNNEGVPLYGEVRDGNSSDKTWNQEVLNKLHEIIPALNKGSIYIADSALITKENLAVIQNQQVRFISRLPETFGMAEEIKQWAWETSRWITLGAISDKKDAAQYKVQSTIRELASGRYRFIAYQSSNLDARKEKTITRQIEKEREALNKACRELGKRTFYCKADAEKEWQLFTKETSKVLHSLIGNIIEETTPKRKIGRPKADSKPEMEITYRIEVKIDPPSQERINDLRAKASTFVLMTNILDEKELSALDVLKEYKGQTAVEVRFRFLKDPTFVDSIYLKNPGRVMALGYIFLIALLIFSLLESRVRRNLKNEDEPLIVPGNRKSFSPTGVSILEMLASIHVARINIDGKTLRQIPNNLFNSQTARLLRLAGYDETIYLQPSNI